MRYASYVPGGLGTLDLADAGPPALTQTPGLSWILDRQPDGRWTLSECTRRTGAPGEPRATSEPMGVIDATFWAGDLTGIRSGRWRPLVEGQRYLWLEG